MLVDADLHQLVDVLRARDVLALGLCLKSYSSRDGPKRAAAARLAFPANPTKLHASHSRRRHGIA
jgi:hypothetical protein